MTKKLIAQESNPSEGLALDLVRLLQDKKARQVTLMNLSRVNPYFDYFVIASTSSRVQMKALAREIQRQFPKALQRKNSSMGAPDLDSGWMVLDFFDLVVHLFLEEQRRYYNLERLWGDAEITLFPEARE